MVWIALSTGNALWILAVWLMLSADDARMAGIVKYWRLKRSEVDAWVLCSLPTLAEWPGQI